MSRKLKFLLYGVLLFVFLVFVSGLFMAWHYQDEVKQLIVSEINKNINTEVSVRDISFSVLRKFPRASVEFRDVLIKVPRDYDHAESHSFSSDTLFTAQNLFLQFNIVDIFRQRYRVTNINARGGVLFLEVNAGQRENYRFWKTSESSAEEFNLDLQDVRLANYRFKFGNHLKGLHIDSDLKRLEMKGDFSQSSYRLQGAVHGINREFRHQELVYSGEQEITAKVALNVNNDLIGIEEGTIEFAGIMLSASGEYDKGENGGIEMNLFGQGLDISSFIRLLPGKNQANLDLYQFNGKFDLEATWSGQISRTRSPSVMAVFSTEKAGIKRKDSGMQLTNIKLNGYYTNGNRQNPETSSVVISNFSSGFGKGSISGKAGISNLSKPAVDFDLKASFLLEELAGFYKPPTILQMAGGINTVLSGNGQLSKFAMPDAGEFSKMNLNGVIEIENGMLEIFEGKYIASLIDGELYFGSKIRTPGLSFNVGSDHFLIAGEIDNGLPWLLGENKTMSLTGSLYSKKLDLDNYFYPLSNERSVNTADSELLLFPDNLEVNLDFMVDDLNFRTFSSTAFRGKLSYKPYMMILNAVDFNSMAGNVTGNGVIFQRLNGDFMVQSQLEMQDVDMQKMFLSFNNFGQTFIHGDNLKGRLTGHLSFISEWSRNLQWKSEETVADSKVEIREGELVDFEPMLGLARYIDVSELRHIRFSTLTNEIFIRNKVVNIPQMDINSSAFDIAGSGTHHFDGQFDYRLRVLLSDVLFGRAGNSKPENTKYGIVEDDGLGRTGLHLLVSGTSGDFKVSYDHRTVRDAIKEGIANERNVLRQLLHKEFGWYSSDTTVAGSANKVNTSAPGFRIKWDEKDEKSAPLPRPAETGNPVSKPGETRFKIIWDEGETP